MSSHDNITTVLQMVAWGTRLTFGLYDFSANVSPAAGDVTCLAKEVNLLSLVLRQVGANLKEDGKLPSENAFDDVREILSQCRDVFGEIEQIVPVRQLQDGQGESPGVDNALVVRLKDGLDWNVLSKAKTQYLLAHLESLKLTLSVMLQTIYTAKISAWERSVNMRASFNQPQLTNKFARQQRSQLAVDAVVTERLQMESLIIEQQLSLLRATRRHGEYKQRAANTPILLNQSPHSQALIRRDQYGPNPRSLIPYQEASLARTTPSPTETEDLARIRWISAPFVDVLLSRWTRLSVVEARIQRLAIGDSSPASSNQSPRSDMRPRRDSNWRPPNVESDSEGEEEIHRNGKPKLHISTPGPVLMSVNGESALPSPIAIPETTNLHPSRGLFSPQTTSSSWGPSGSTGYFPASPRTTSGRLRPSPTPSPLSSPRESFAEATDGPVRPVTAFKPTEQRQAPQRLPIPWRLRLRNNYWDFHDDVQISSNTSTPPTNAKQDRKTVTEIMKEFVSRDAIMERNYDYERVKKDSGDRRKTRLETCYCVDGALTFQEVQHLVNRTRQIRNPHSRRSSQLPPPLDRSHTSPATYSIGSARGSYHSNSHSNTSDSDSFTAVPRRRDHTRHDSASSRRRDSVSRRGESRSRRESGVDGKNKKTATLTKLAMGGAGMLTLLDGLPEVLNYL